MSRKKRDKEIEILKDIDRELHKIEKDLHPKPKLSAGKVIIMPKTIAVGGTSTATLALLDQNSASMVIDSTYSVTYSSSNPGNVTFGTPNADGSNTVVGVAVDPGNSIGAVVTGGPENVNVTLTADMLIITAAAQTLTSGSVVLS